MEIVRQGSTDGIEYCVESGNPKLWVAVSGLDGCGKTTSSKFMFARLAPKSKWWKSPHSDWVRENMKIAGQDQYGRDRDTDIATFVASHRIEQYRIRDWWNGTQTEEGADFLVSQRANLDFYTFLETEGMSREDCETALKVKTLTAVPAPYAGRFIAPHAVVWLDCDAHTAMSRIKRGDKWEEVPFLSKLEQAYPNFFENPPEYFEGTRVYKVDGRQTPRAVQAQLDEIVDDIRKVYAK